MLTLHPLASLFPEMDLFAYAALKADIALNGQREPIVVHEGQIIDGRHRLRACLDLGIEPLVRDVTSDHSDPTALVISLNLHRRHLSESQRAMVAARLSQLPVGVNQHTPIGTASSLTTQEAAEQLNVGKRSVNRAKEVMAQGIPDLVNAVDSGKIAVSTAAQVAQLPDAVQQALLNHSPDAIRAIAQEIKARITAANATGEDALRLFDDLMLEKGLGALSQMAVVEALKAQNQPLPSPEQAQRMAAHAPAGTAVLASDGKYHAGSQCDSSLTDCWLSLREGLESFAQMRFTPEQAVAAVPAYQQRNVSDWLSKAMPFLQSFNQQWSQHYVSA